MNNDEFSEKKRRENNIYIHSTIIFTILLFANSMLLTAGINWAEGADQNLIILFATLLVGNIERMLYNIQIIKTKYDIIIMSIVGIVSIVLIIWSIIDLIKGEPFFSNNGLSHTGGILVTMVLLLLICASSLISISNKRKFPENQEIA